MDLQTALVCVGLAGMSAIVIFAISIFSMKEKTYEEAIAEQRKMPEEHLLLGRSAKEKAKDKKLKKAGKKVKEKLEKEKHESAAHGGSDKIHVDFSKPVAEVLKEHPPVEEKKKKKEKVKPILLNKAEAPLIAESPIIPVNHFEEIVPKDDLLKKKTHAKDNAGAQHAASTENIKAGEKTVANSKITSKGEKDKANSGKIEKEKTAKVEKAVAKIEKNIQKTEVVKAENALPKQDKAAIKLEKASVSKTEVTTKSEKNLPKSEKTTVKTEKHEQKPEKIISKESIPPKGDKPSKTETAGSSKLEKPASSNSSISPVETQIQPAPVAKESKKKKKSELAVLQQMTGEREGVNVGLLMPLVEKAELSRSEIQILIDLLLNKQQSTAVVNSEWIEDRQDPVVKLKKLLAEKEKALQEEQEKNLGVHNKLKELRTEYNSERSRLNQNFRQAEEALLVKQNEAQNLAARLQHAVDQHNAEKQSLNQQLQQLQSKFNEASLHLRQVQDEQKQSQHLLQQELLTRQQHDIHIVRIKQDMDQKETELRNKIEELHNQLQIQENMNSKLNAELKSLTDGQLTETKMLKDRNTQLENQILHLESQLKHLRESSEHAQDLSKQLEELKLHKTQLESCVNSSKQNEVQLQYEINCLKKELETSKTNYNNLLEVKDEASYLKKENEKLCSQISSLKESQIEFQNLKNENDRLRTEASTFRDLQREAMQLREENENLASQVTAVTERPAAEGRENGDIQFNEEKDTVGDTSKVLKSELEQKNVLLEDLRKEVFQKNSLIEKLNSEVETYQTELVNLKNDLEIQRTRNDETAQNIRKDIENSSKLLLQRLFPNISVQDTQTFDLWLERFETAASKYLADLSSNVSALSSAQESSVMMLEYEKQNSHLQAMVAHYKTIIEDTEGMLNKLQNHVEQEEARWRQQLQQKEAEIEALKEEQKKDEMQSKLEEMSQKLKCEIEEKENIRRSLASAQESYDKLQSRITENEKSSVSLTKLLQESERLQSELQQERDRCEDLNKEVAKLKGLVKIGTDSLSEKQQVVETLQEQLDKVNGLNNSATSSNGSPVDSSVHQGGSRKRNQELVSPNNGL